MNRELPKTHALWEYKLTVECPHCETDQEIDLGKIDEWWIVLAPVCESNENVNHIYTCDDGDCGKDFVISEINF